MTSHSLDDTVEMEPQRPQSPGSALTVVLAAIVGITLVALGLVMVHAADQAEAVVTLAMMIGAGMAIGFRKQWTRR